MKEHKNMTCVVMSITCVLVMSAASLRDADLPIGRDIPPMRPVAATITATVTPTSPTMTDHFTL